VSLKGPQRLLVIPRERTNAFALLRTCRQIYAETALLPLTINTLTVKSLPRIGPLLREMRKYQRSQIAVFKVEISDPRRTTSHSYVTQEHFKEAYLETHLPCLRRIHICLYPARNGKPETIVEGEAFLNSKIAPGLVARGYEVEVEAMAMDYSTFHHL